MREHTVDPVLKGPINLVFLIIGTTAYLSAKDRVPLCIRDLYNI